MRLRKAVSLAVTAAMVFSLAACGSGGGNTGESAAVNTGQTANESVQAEKRMMVFLMRMAFLNRENFLSVKNQLR